MHSRRVLFAVLICIATLIAAFASATAKGKPSRVVVMIDYNAHGFVYTINSEDSRAQDLLLTLSKKHETEQEADVILLVHNKVTLAMVNNVIGILSKAGYADPPRVFVFDSYKIAMNELNFTYSPRVPFSAAGDVPAKK
jgi:hypothetical protein